MSHESRQRTVSIDEIPVDPAVALNGDVDPVRVPDEIRSITYALAEQEPPSNPLVVLKAARWWYAHGEGATDPVFRWAIEWTRSLSSGGSPDVRGYHEFLDHLVEIGLADDRQDLRSRIE